MTATRTRRRRGRAGGPSHCRWCGAEIMWQTHVTTGKVAPIDWAPVPGGNILIHGDTYEVLVGSEREALDPTVEDENAVPTLRLNHHTTCTSSRGRGSSAAPTDADFARWRGPDIASLRAGEKPDDD